MERIVDYITAVCSNKPRQSVQKGAKGNQHWKRDVFHARHSGMTTFCKRDCSEWLTIGVMLNGAAKSDPNFCSRCCEILSN